MIDDLKNAVSRLGSIAALAAVLIDDEGRSATPAAVTMWLQRGKVPYRWRGPLVGLINPAIPDAGGRVAGAMERYGDDYQPPSPPHGAGPEQQTPAANDSSRRESKGDSGGPVKARPEKSLRAVAGVGQ